MYEMKRGFIILMLAISLALGLEHSAISAEFPNRPILMVNIYTAGGSTDVAGRALANAASKFLGQPVIVENRVGGGGVVGTTFVQTSSPDGYTIGIMSSGAMIVSWHMGKMKFNPIEDLTHIMNFTGYIWGLVVRNDSPFKTMQEFIKYSKENPQKVSYGSAGIGTGSHMAMEELAVEAGGIKWIHIPYKGGSEAYTALLGGHVEAVSDSSGWGPLVEAGKFRVLSIFTDKRAARYPQAPTLKEIG
jgi:tripartite-type tricarboxylate transporter receptor subunit TctC